MKQVVGTLDEARLAQGKERQGEWVWIRELADVGDRLVNPGIFVVGEIYVVERVLDERRVRDVCVPGQ